jgi:hypothetical protein
MMNDLLETVMWVVGLILSILMSVTVMYVFMITITWVFSIEITPGYIIFPKVVSGIGTLTLVSYSFYVNWDE